MLIFFGLRRKQMALGVSQTTRCSLPALTTLQSTLYGIWGRQVPLLNTSKSMGGGLDRIMPRDSIFLRKPEGWQLSPLLSNKILSLLILGEIRAVMGRSMTP